MDSNTIYVVSQADWTLVIDVPDIPLKRTWSKRGAKYPINRDQMIRAYYDPSVEFLFKKGLLVTEDKDFLREVGLLDENEESMIAPLEESMMARMIKVMPMKDFKEKLATLNETQIEMLADYAIDHYTELKLDRVDLLSKASRKNIMKSIENFKSATEN